MDLSVLQLLQGPVSRVWHGLRACVFFEREGTNWVGCSLLMVQAALWAVGRVHGVSRLAREKKNFTKLFASYKADFLVCCHHSDSNIWDPCAKLWIPKVWAGEWVHMQSHSRAGVPCCLWEAGVTSSWEQGLPQRWQISLGVWSGL